MGVRGHQARHEFGGRGVATIFFWVGNCGVGEAVLVIDGNDGEALLVSDVAGERLEVGDDQVDLPLLNELLEAGPAFRCLRNRYEVLSDGALVAHAVIHIGEAEAVNLGDIEVFFQILQAPVKGGNVDPVPLGDKMGDDFLGAGRVSRTLAVYSIKDVGHGD